jgi:hypothetical protein
MARVLVPFTEGHYYGKEEKPNTGLADNSLLVGRLYLQIYYIIMSTVIEKIIIFRFKKQIAYSERISI